MDEIKQRIRKLFGLYLATHIKMDRDTPANIKDELISFCESDEPDSKLPMSVQPYKESVKLCRNIITLSNRLLLLKEEHPDKYKEVLDEEWFNDKEEIFIEWYKKQKKGG